MLDESETFDQIKAIQIYRKMVIVVMFNKALNLRVKICVCKMGICGEPKVFPGQLLCCIFIIHCKMQKCSPHHSFRHQLFFHSF